ncbi:MAG TPA: hypothetical protein VF325_05895 [Candidatus Deferrimicrobium sp.]
MSRKHVAISVVVILLLAGVVGFLLLRGVFLKGVGVRVLWPQMAALLLLGAATLAIATRRFRKTLT